MKSLLIPNSNDLTSKGIVQFRSTLLEMQSSGLKSGLTESLNALAAIAEFKFMMNPQHSNINMCDKEALKEDLENCFKDLKQKEESLRSKASKSNIDEQVIKYIDKVTLDILNSLNPDIHTENFLKTTYADFISNDEHFFQHTFTK